MTSIRPNKRKHRILVVEDESILRRLLVTTLRGEGYEVWESDNGYEGHRQAVKHHPDLVLLDIIMPSMNGIEMLRQLRQDTWGKTANVVLLTNLDDVDNMNQGMRYGVTDYFIKSDWSLDELAREVRAKLA